MEFLLENGNRSKALADELAETYHTLADALRDYRIDALDRSTRATIAVVRDLATSRLKRKRGNWRHKVGDVESAGRFFQAWFEGLDNEELAVLYLDADRRMIDCATEAVGEQCSVSVDPRRILRHATVLEAKYIIVAHNHPDTLALPSSEDLTATTVLAWSIEAAGFKLLDHIIVYDHDFVSLFESGLISSDRRIADARLSIQDGRLGISFGDGASSQKRGGAYNV